MGAKQLTKLTKLTKNQSHALDMINRFGRSTDKRSVDALVKKGIVYISHTDRIGVTWSDKGTIAYFCDILSLLNQGSKS